MKATGYDPNWPIDIAIVDGVRIIINGHHRARAAGAAKILRVPVQVWNVTEEQGTRILMQAAEVAEKLGIPF